MMEFVYSLEEINAAAAAVLDAAKESKVLAFSGDMGAGKTTLIHAICHKIGIRGTLSSPTFAIINEYSVDGRPVYHIDLYRCKDEDEAIRAGVEDCLYSGNLCLVEWPSRAKEIFPSGTLLVSLSEVDERTRKLSVGQFSGKEG